MVTGIEHIAILSADTGKIKDWYQKLFGGEVVYDNKKGTYFLAFPDKSMIEFVKSDIPNGENEMKTGGIRHIALTVSEENFDSLVENIKNENAEVVADVVVSASNVKTFFFRDIDGNILHLICRPEPLV